MDSTRAGPAIDLRAVTKLYRRRVLALAGVDIRVERGEVFGLLGPNGAGKSTLVKIMMTVVRPTRAEGTILGQPVGHKPTLRSVGYLPENHRFPRYLTGRQTIEFFAALAGVGRAARRRRAGELIETIGMSGWADQKISTYSKGMMQRIGLGQALSADPDLLVLDEPTDGVDPVGRRDIRQVLARLRDAGKTVFVNSHLLSEVEIICDRVAILIGGQVARQGSVDELTRGTQRYEIELAGGADLGQRTLVALADWFDLAAPGTDPAAPGIGVQRGRAPGGGPTVEWDSPVLRVETSDPLAVQPALDAVRRAGLTVRRLELIRQSLEELFVDAVVDSTTGRAAPVGAGLGVRRTPLPPRPVTPEAP